MKAIRVLVVLLVFGVALLAAPMASACPSCNEAPNATNSDEFGSNNPRAYNHSIYFMVFMPYATLGVLTYAVYRGMKKNEEYRRAREQNAAEDTTPLAGSAI